MNFISEDMYEWLSSRADDYKTQYAQAKPFPHIVLSNLFEGHKLREIAASFPQATLGRWWKYENLFEKKLARNDIHTMHHSIRCLIHELMENRFVSFLEKITGIQGLIVDHTLNGGGLHQILRGGKLDIHADYNYHPVTGLDRRLNVLLYLNTNWRPGWNGSLEFWNKDMTECVKSIAPMINELVIFSTTDTAYHGHPDPLMCPIDETRKSIALYYYTNGRSADEKSAPHSTVFKRRPQDPYIEDEEQLRISRAVRRTKDLTT